MFDKTDFSGVKDRGAPTDWLNAPEDGSTARFLGRIVSAEYDKDDMKGVRVFLKFEVLEARDNCDYPVGRVLTNMIKPNPKAGGTDGFINSLVAVVASLEGCKSTELEDPKESLTNFFDNDFDENPITMEVTYMRHKTKVKGADGSMISEVTNFTKMFLGAAE